MNVKAMNKDMQRRSIHSGSSFDDFLEGEGIRNEVESVAIKRVLAWQFEQEMEKQRKTKQGMARELRTSRSQLDRLLDPANTAVSLETLTRAANVLGKRLVFEIRDKAPARKARIRSAAKGKVSVSVDVLRATTVRASKAG
jgi:antitoxin HicB